MDQKAKYDLRVNVRASHNSSQIKTVFRISIHYSVMRIRFQVRVYLHWDSDPDPGVKNLNKTNLIKNIILQSDEQLILQKSIPVTMFYSYFSLPVLQVFHLSTVTGFFCFFTSYIRIQEVFHNADPCRSGSESLL